MTVIPVRHIPDPVLREKTRRIPTITSALRSLIDNMVETMDAENGVGIAANQVGKRLRIAYIEIPEERDEEGEVVQEAAKHILINPEIIRRVGEREVDEGCLSIPGWRGTLIRSVRVTAKALDVDGREVRIKADGLLAQALEHETDHLDGVVYIDRIQDIKDIFPIGPPGEGADEERVTNTGEPAPPPDSNLIWRFRRSVAPVSRRV